MGGCFSVSLSCDQMVNQVSQWLCLKESYIHNLPENLESLEKAIEILKAKRDDVQRRIDREEFTGSHGRFSQVEVWLKNVLTIENQVSDLLSTNKVELQRLCLCSFCSKDLKKSYRYGKNVIMMLKEVESLSSQNEFVLVTEATPVAQAEELPIQSIIVGQKTLFERVWNHLMEDRIGIVGLYGMGGVGKTTLLTQINNNFTKIGGRFDVVIWVVVSNGATIHKIQGNIGEKLGLRGNEWECKTESQRAINIHNILRRQNFVLLLDDIWEKVNLEAVGVPNPNRENKCKVAFTTRSREVCARMGVDNPIKVSCLDPDKAWELFQKKVGVNTLGSHPDIPKLARKFASKCRGLPLALNVIGETMACKTTIQEWNHAIDVLTASAIEFSGMENEILPILKYSYDNLSGKQVKPCFLYCSLFPEDSQIEKERLIDYWICEGLIDEKKDRERELNKGYEILGILIGACLLLDEAWDKSSVSMHDVIREMAIWISSDLGKQKEQYIVQAGVNLHEVPKVKNWEVVRMMSLMNNEIKQIVDSPECPQLTTLLLQRNCKLSTISGEFFRSMPILLVLDLSSNDKLVELPEEISNLVSLRYLDLAFTNIERLPLGLPTLKMLIHLNLEHTRRLKSLNGISNFSSLKVIRLQTSKIKLDMRLMKELELLEHLEFVSIDISSNMIREQWFYNSKVGKCIQNLQIIESPEESASILVLPTLMVNPRNIIISGCGILDIKIEKTTLDRNLANPCFSNLSSIYVIDCNGVNDLTCLLFAPNLTCLRVYWSHQVEAIIKEEKALEDEETYNIIPFKKLKHLHLENLPLLKSIYWNSLAFPCLKKIEILECSNLRKLPLDSQSVIKIEEFSIYSSEKNWKERVKWKDEATKLRFLPTITTTKK